MWILRSERLKNCCGPVGGPVGPGTPGGSVALCLCHQAYRYLCNLSVAAGLSVSQNQEETKQCSTTSLLRDNGGHAHHPHWCHGGASLPPSIGVCGAT